MAGLDVNRLILLIAVLARRAGVDVSGRDVYASLTGGLTVSEPALDLPLALAIAASQRDRVLGADTLACGEVSLMGELRPVPGLERRLREAARLGFRRALVPAEPAVRGCAGDAPGGGAWTRPCRYPAAGPGRRLRRRLRYLWVRSGQAPIFW